MQRQAWPFAVVVAACALALGACSKQADGNANAPGSPGTGNTAEVVRPAAPDSPPGGPSGIAGSAAHPGSSGGDVIPGTTGSGSSEIAGRSQTAQPGTGINGGLGGSNSVMGAAPATDGNVTSAPGGTGSGSTPGGNGSTNSTSSSAVGQR